MKKRDSLYRKTAPRLATLCLALIATSTYAGQVTYTTDTQFNQGAFDATAANNGALELTTTGSTFPVLWVANAGEDTISKIDTENNVEIARYRTWFNVGTHGAWSGPAPSRTSVDTDGNVFVANRHFDNRPAMVMKILASGGIDRNGNGVIDTSTSSATIPLVDSNGNGRIDPDELADERVAWAVQVGPNGGLGRSLCTDTQGFVWVGLYSSRQYYKLNPADGHVVSGPHAVGWTPYGCAVDKNGILWSASLGGALGKLDTNNPATTTYYNGPSNYGIAVGNDRVYTASGSVQQFNPATNSFSNMGTVGGYGLSVDGVGDIVTGYSNVGKYHPSGAAVWVNNTHYASDGRGVVYDGNGDIWQIDLGNNRARKFSGTTGAFLTQVNTGLSPYTYSDATGIGARTQTTQTGFWTIVLDGGADNARWNKVCWSTDLLPVGAAVTADSRAANTVPALDNVNREARGNCTPLVQQGRYLELRAKLAANSAGESPEVGSISVQTRVCDVDLDNDVDNGDLTLIKAALNTSASHFADPRDADGNGTIQINDVRTCTLQCTRARCATNTVF